MNSRPSLRSLPRLAIAATTLAVLAGCTTAPLSYINDRQVYYRAVLHRYPVFVDAVDGVSTAFRPIPIGPGVHQVKIEALPVAGFSQTVQKTYPMKIEPCTRYYIAAQRTSPLTQDWDLVVEETWPVAGCDPEKEWAKARASAPANSLTSSIESIPAQSTVALSPPR